MIIRYRSNSIIELKIIFIRSIVSPPSNNIIRRELCFCIIHFPKILVNNFPFLCFIFKPSSWIHEIFRISESICSYRTQFWQSEMMSESFSNPSFDLPFNFNCEFNASGDNTNLFGTYYKLSH